MYRVDLTEEQREELTRRARAHGVMPRTRERLESVRLSDADWSIPRIARHLRRTEPTVRSWIKRFLQAGFEVLSDQPHRGQQSAVTPAILAALRREMEQGNYTWTAAQAAEWVALHHGLQVTPGWLATLMNRAQLSYKRTQRRLKHKQDPEAVAQKREELAAAEKGALRESETCAISTRRASPPPCPRPTVGGR